MLRISGLIKFADTVRRELPASPGSEHRERLRNRVAAFVQQVDEILRDNRATIRHVPPPSQRAYQFLTSIDWSNAPVTQAGVTTPDESRTIVAWRGMSTFVDRSLNRLAIDLSEPELKSVGEMIARTSRQIELTIERDNVSPDRLSPTTRAQRGWLGVFSREKNLAAYTQARRTASSILNAAAGGSRHYPPPLTIHFRPVTGIYKLRATRRGPILWLPTPMIAFDGDEFSAVAALIFDRTGEARQRVLAGMTGDGYQAVRAELESLGGIVEQARGAAHDLAESFDRVNADYFGGKMPRPRLTWNRTFTGRKFGHYDWIHDTVMVTRTLDSPTVPPFVVDFLVFHELLHKFHGIHWLNGRGYSHTAEFYESERKFARFNEAEEILERLARSVR